MDSFNALTWDCLKNVRKIYTYKIHKNYRVAFQARSNEP
jgi:hypothetical protein